MAASSCSSILLSPPFPCSLQRVPRIRSSVLPSSRHSSPTSSALLRARTRLGHVAEPLYGQLDGYFRVSKEARLSVRAKAVGDGQSDGEGGSGGDPTAVIASIGLGLLWLGFGAYAFTLAPSQTPFRDQYFIQKLLFLRADDGFAMNPVLVSLWNLMGVWPLVYAMLLIPTARSSKGPPIWPFSLASAFIGAFALLPYFALWRGEGPPELPSEEEKQSWPLRIFESKITAVVAAVGTVTLIGNAAFAGEEAWVEFLQYFRESQFIHITSIDFLILCGMAPFWLYNDMTAREWEGRDTWWVPLAAVPLVGPVIHLLIRPKLP